MVGCEGDRERGVRKAEVGTSVRHLVVTPMWIDEGWKEWVWVVGGGVIGEGCNELIRLLHLRLLPIHQAWER